MQVVWLILMCFLSGCQGGNKGNKLECDEPAFQKAQQCLRENNVDEAFKLLRRLVDQRVSDCPETHFELGRLYLNIKKDPIFAIYHFRQNLMQKPENKRAHLVLQMIDTAKKEFARTLPLNDRYGESHEYLRLTEMLKQVRAENARLKKQLSQIQFSKKVATPMTNEVVASVAPIAAYQARTYIVRSEDSLSKISLKMYGSAVKWKVIYDANRDILSSANSLKIGMRLRIPALNTVPQTSH